MASLTTEELRSLVEPLDVELGDGGTAGYARITPDLPLGAVETAYGEERAIYDEAAFPGVVFPAEDQPVTIAVSGDGTLAVLDAADTDEASAAIEDAVDQLRYLSLLSDDDTVETVVPAEEIPFSLVPPGVETLGSGTAE